MTFISSRTIYFLNSERVHTRWGQGTAMENFYNINGQDIHVEEVGPQHGPIAILIHGWSSSWVTWKALLPPLSNGYRCIVIDLPGFGKAPAPTERPTIAGYADLVGKLIEEFSDRSVLV